ncbi:DNA-binding GntR family transcriptional regulator [Amycolatopsis thermophila]|uniref:DNA-binding GntR family transcriptional regulator n=2 Tax=Amycolatopsis thermophila TaxID=206084 RepID=A0ABU0EPI7_9PSEU|nr:GntR family transcriptional regulator [Amycolatopsis thermophila]MDQ0376900.1 DNA-binding GntR family transcriptional regulator [Amycolatopsis thermophila]
MSTDAESMGSILSTGLEADRLLLGRTSTAERLADILRTRITEGFFEPGSRLSEEAIGGALGVSRNTLREAFRLLTHEKLLIHELNRGVFVRRLSIEDVTDLYKVRKLVQCAVLREITSPPGDKLQAVEAAVADGEDARKRQAWRELGTANIHFHQALITLAGSPRVDELVRGLLAELRLVFHVMADPQPFHEPYLERNREILETLRTGDGLAAEKLLAAYLDDAEKQLVDAYRRVM